jgi:hypothetical protein
MVTSLRSDSCINRFSKHRQVIFGGTLGSAVSSLPLPFRQNSRMSRSAEPPREIARARTGWRNLGGMNSITALEIAPPYIGVAPSPPNPNPPFPPYFDLIHPFRSSDMPGSSSLARSARLAAATVDVAAATGREWSYSSSASMTSVVVSFCKP